MCENIERSSKNFAEQKTSVELLSNDWQQTSQQTYKMYNVWFESFLSEISFK